MTFRARIRVLFSTVTVVTARSVAYALEIPATKAQTHLCIMTSNSELERVNPSQRPAIYRRAA